MFFVLNPGRSGSRTIAQVLSQSPDCECQHEPFPRFIAEAPRFLYGEIDQRELVATLTRTRSRTVDGKVYGESANKLSLMIPALIEAFPEAQLVRLVRDGRDFVCSGLQRGWYDEQELTEPANDWQRWRLRGDLAGDMSADAWNDLNRFERICWLWEFTNRVIEKDIRRFRGDDFFLVRIEELGHCLPELCEWLGIHPTVFVVNRANRRARAELAAEGTSRTNIVEEVHDWRQWTDAEREVFTRHGGDLMDRLYPQWRDADGQWRSTAVEIEAEGPPAVFAGTTENRSRTEAAHSADASPAIGEMLASIRADVAELKTLRNEMRTLARQQKQDHGEDRKRLEDLEAQLNRARREYEILQTSRSYRIGRIITQGLKAPLGMARSVRRSLLPRAASGRRSGPASDAAPDQLGAASTPDLVVPVGRHVTALQPESTTRVMIVLIGLTVEQVEQCVEEIVREQLIVGGFAPLFITDCDRFDLFRNHDFLFEFIPPASDDPPSADPVERAAYLDRRMQSILQAYKPQRILVFDDPEHFRGLRTGVLDPLLSAPSK